MSTKQKLHQLHLNEWASRFADQKASGLTVRQWCDQNNCSIHTYNYWKHLLKEELASQVLPDIVSLTMSGATLPCSSASMLPPTCTPLESSLTNSAIRATQATATLTINSIAIQIDSDISEDFLRTIIKAVRYA